MALYVAYFSFRPGSSVAQGLLAFERRRGFQHPPRARVLGEYWVAAPADKPQAVLIWDAEDDGPADYYEAAWGDLFEVTVCRATPPVTELPSDLGSLAATMGGTTGSGDSA